MKKWEYLVVVLCWNSDMDRYYWGGSPCDEFKHEHDALDYYGENGWELINMTLDKDSILGDKYTFKREKLS